MTSNFIIKLCGIIYVETSSIVFKIDQHVVIGVNCACKMVLEVQISRGKKTEILNAMAVTLN